MTYPPEARRLHAARPRNHSPRWSVVFALASLGACSQDGGQPPATTTAGASVAGTGAAGISATGASGSGGSAVRTGAAGNAAGGGGAPSGPGAIAGTSGATSSAGTTGGAGAAGIGTPGDVPTPAAGAPATAGTGATVPAAASCNSGSALDLLRRYAPSDEDLRKDFEGYLTEELGDAACATEGTGAPRMITQTIVVPPDTVYDGRGEKLTADVAAMRCDTSEGEQAEHQRPFFVLAPGASLENVTITYPGCEGIHMLGNNVLDNIVWEDAGEDAASVRSYFPGGKIEIKNSEGHKAADKMFQFNAPCDVRIEHFTGSDMGKLVRQNGGTEFELHVDLNSVDVTGVISAVVQSDSPNCYVRHHALTYSFTGSGDKSDRVFRDVPPANVTQY
jgi:pectate lyase C